MHPQPWMARARCAQTDPEIFYPEKGGATRDAKRVCNGNPDRDIPPCPVRDQCLQWALDTGEEHGIWGGVAARDRLREIRARRRQQAAERLEEVAA